MCFVRHEKNVEVKIKSIQQLLSTYSSAIEVTNYSTLTIPDYVTISRSELHIQSKTLSHY